MAKGGGAAGLPGFRDFYPEEFAARAFILQTWRDVARRFGFVEYDGPPLEPLDLYTLKSGDEIVGQLYEFTDKGERRVALRPEMTPTFARMVGARANALRKPIRWFSIPQLFRYERQQKGRLREHFQLNVDIVGESDVTADAELLAVAIESVRAFGLGPEDVKARVSDRRLWAARFGGRGISASELPQLFTIVDKMPREPRAVSAEKLAEMRLSTAIIDEILAFARSQTIDEFIDQFGTNIGDMAASTRDLTRYAGYLQSLGVLDHVLIDTRIVRGLAYYTGIVFELFDAKGEFRAICGGGRYDTLLASLSGTDLPALGFGMGDVVLGELLKARGKMPSSPIALDYWVAYEDQSLLAEAMRTATTLRRQGSSVEYALRPQSLGKQLDAARKAGARVAVIHRVDGAVKRKDFASGTEEPFTFPNG